MDKPSISPQNYQNNRDIYPSDAQLFHV